MSRFRQLTFSDSYIWNLAWERNLLELSATYSDPVRSSSFKPSQRTEKRKSLTNPKMFQNASNESKKAKLMSHLKIPLSRSLIQTICTQKAARFQRGIRAECALWSQHDAPAKKNQQRSFVFLTLLSPRL